MWPAYFIISVHYTMNQRFAVPTVVIRFVLATYISKTVAISAESLPRIVLFWLCCQKTSNALYNVFARWLLS